MQTIATVCANVTHASRIKRIAHRHKLPLILMLGSQVFVSPDKPKEPGNSHFDASTDGLAVVSSLRRALKRLELKGVTYYPPPEPKAYVYETALRRAAGELRPKVEITVAGRDPDPQPA